jgi:hypothetical protein
MRAFLFGFLTAILLMVAMAIGGLVMVGRALAIEDPLTNADVIVAISGDTGARTEMAVSLWKGSERRSSCSQAARSTRNQ